eukprot:m.347779 g.347779  ORF g.347779 m.347779 type:complete len:56 (+) comp20672_c1_seq5:176-343(+)
MYTRARHEGCRAQYINPFPRHVTMGSRLVHSMCYNGGGRLLCMSCTSTDAVVCAL